MAQLLAARYCPPLAENWVHCMKADQTCGCTLTRVSYFGFQLIYISSGELLLMSHITIESCFLLSTMLKLHFNIFFMPSDMIYTRLRPTKYIKKCGLVSQYCLVCFFYYSPNRKETHNCLKTFSSFHLGASLTRRVFLYLPPAYTCFLFIQLSSLHSFRIKGTSFSPVGGLSALAEWRPLWCGHVQARFAGQLCCCDFLNWEVWTFKGC